MMRRRTPLQPQLAVCDSAEARQTFPELTMSAGFQGFFWLESLLWRCVVEADE